MNNMLGINTAALALSMLGCDTGESPRAGGRTGKRYPNRRGGAAAARECLDFYMMSCQKRVI